MGGDWVRAGRETGHRGRPRETQGLGSTGGGESQYAEKKARVHRLPPRWRLKTRQETDTENTTD